MKINSEDILTRTFGRSTFGGYKTTEVAGFLKDISAELEEQNRLNEDLSKKLEEKEALIRENRDREDILKNVMLSAQSMANEMKKNAQSQADAIVEDARQKAHLIVQDARDSLKTAYQDLSDLKRIHIQLKNTLQAVLQSHQDLLDQDPMHSILPSTMRNKDTGSAMEKKLTESLNQAAGRVQGL